MTHARAHTHTHYLSKQNKETVKFLVLNFTYLHNSTHTSGGNWTQYYEYMHMYSVHVQVVECLTILLYTCTLLESSFHFQVILAE